MANTILAVATLDGDMPRRGGVPAGIVAGEEHRSTGTCPVVAASPAGSLLARSNARRGHAPSWRRSRRNRCWRGATLDGDMPRRGGVPAGIVAGEEHRSTGTCPVVAASPPESLLARSNARRGHAPSWRRPRRDRCWRGASLDGDMPRRGGVPAGIVAGEEQRSTGTCPVVAASPAGIVAGEEHRSTGTCPVVAASPPESLLARSNARRGHAPSWRRSQRESLLARSIARRGLAPSWRRFQRNRCWRGATLDGDMPRRGGVPTGIVAGEEQRSTGTCHMPRRGGVPAGIAAGEEHRSTGTCPVVAAFPAESLLARSNARRGHAPSWRRPRRNRCWRGASLDGDMPRRGGVPSGIVAGEEQRSTGTCPVVAAFPAESLLARSIARRGHAPSWRRPRRDRCLARSNARRGHAPSWRRSQRNRCWRGATLDGDMPRRGGVPAGIVAGAARFHVRPRGQEMMTSPGSQRSSEFT